jgi:hypothetical protein
MAPITNFENVISTHSVELNVVTSAETAKDTSLALMGHNFSK